MGLGGAFAEASDAREDVVCGLGPRVGLGIAVVRFDELADVLFELIQQPARLVRPKGRPEIRFAASPAACKRIQAAERALARAA